MCVPAHGQPHVTGIFSRPFHLEFHLEFQATMPQVLLAAKFSEETLLGHSYSWASSSFEELSPWAQNAMFPFLFLVAGVLQSALGSTKSIQVVVYLHGGWRPLGTYAEVCVLMPRSRCKKKIPLLSEIRNYKRKASSDILYSRRERKFWKQSNYCHLNPCKGDSAGALSFIDMAHRLSHWVSSSLDLSC